MNGEQLVIIRIDKDEYCVLAKDVRGVSAGTVLMGSNGVQIALVIDEVIGVADNKMKSLSEDGDVGVFRIGRWNRAVENS